jgi:DNA polymerase-3 subunit gamma/tau
VLLGRQGSVVRLALDARNQIVRTRAQEDKLAQALGRYYGAPVRLELSVMDAGASETPAEVQQRTSLAEIESARQALTEDPTVRALQERFGATLLPESVRPTK